MVLQSLTVRNFRIHTQSGLQFSEGLNFFVGGNGEGKTTLLEAIYFLCTTKNYKGAPDNELLRFEENEYEIRGHFTGAVEHKARVAYAKQEGKRSYSLDGKNVSKASDVIGKFPVVLLTPDDHTVTSGSPAERRRFVDSVISQANKVYLNTLIEYNRILRQRGALLNLLREQRRQDYLDELSAWDTQLINAGNALIATREKFCAEFVPFVSEAYRQIMSDAEEPGINYFFLGEQRAKHDATLFAAMLAARREEEIRRASNLVGPHRDDFLFSVNGKNLKTFGSQGQHKTFQVALRFAEFFYLKEKSGEAPLFLLDDVFGELDTNRSVRISESLKTVGQAFITITDFSNYRFLATQPNDRVFTVSEGAISNG